MFVLWCGFVLLGAGILAAQQAQESAPEALRIFQGGSNLLQNSQYDLAVEEFDKLVKRYPQDPLVPKARYYGAVCRMRMEEYGPAAASFESLAREYPKFELREDALLNAGWCLYRDAQRVQDAAARHAALEKAATPLKQLLQEFPQGKHRDQAHYFLAECLYSLEQYESAVSQYRQVIENFPKSAVRAEALVGLGIALQMLGKWSDAVTAYDTFLQQFPEHELTHDVTLYKAESLIQMGRSSEAEPLLEQLSRLSDYANADYALLLRASCYEQRSDFSQAASLYEEVVKRFPNSSHSVEAEVGQGRCLFRAEQYPQARALLERVVQRQEKPPVEALHWLCRSYLRMGQPQLAEPVAQRGVSAAESDGPWKARLTVDLADALAEQPDKKQQAVQVYMRVAEQFPADVIVPQALYSAASVSWELGRYEEAKALAERLRSAYASDPLAADARRIIAEAHVIAKNYQAAAEEFTRIIAEYPQHPDRQLWRLRLAHVKLLNLQYADVIEYLSPIQKDFTDANLSAEAASILAQAYFYQQDYQNALMVLRNTLTEHPNTSRTEEILLWMARCYQRSGENAKAIQQLEELLQRFPETHFLTQAYYRLGELYAAEKQSDKAAAMYERALRAARTSMSDTNWIPLILVAKGWNEVQASQFAAAITTFSEFLDNFADHESAPSAWKGRGLAYLHAGEYDKASADFQQVLRRISDGEKRADELLELSRVYFSKNRYAEALQLLDEIVRTAPQYARMDAVLYEQGWNLKNMNNESEALKKFRSLIEAFPKSTYAPEAYFHIAENDYQNMQYEEAVKNYQQCLSNAEGDLREKALYKLGFSYYNLGQFDQAYKTFADQAASHANGTLVGDAWFMQGECLLKLGKSAEALSAYRRALELSLSSQQVKGLAYLHAAQAAAALEKWQEVVTFTTELLTQIPNTSLKPLAIVERAEAMYKLDRLDEALAGLEEIAENQDALAMRARFVIGEILFKQRKHADAHREFRKVMYLYGGNKNKLPEEMAKWQRLAGLEAGRCCEVLLGAATTPEQKSAIYQDAVKAYKYVTENFPDTPEAKSAASRLQELSKMRF